MKSRLIVVLLVAACLPGCVRIEIGGDSVPTLGEELLDLYSARERGLLNDEEFDRLKSALFTQLH